MTSNADIFQRGELVRRLALQTGTAIRSSDEIVSYSLLVQKIRALQAVIRLQIAPGTIVAVVGEPSWKTCAFFFAIIEAGCVALLLDGNWPKHWRDNVLTDANPSCVFYEQLPDNGYAFREPTTGFYGCLALAQQSATTVQDNAAYLVYTSGTTGQPKGVINSLEGVLNLFTVLPEVLGLSSSDKVLQFASPSFDAWVWEVFLAFSVGATLILPKSKERLPGLGLEQLIASTGVTVATLPPSVITYCRPEDFSCVKTLIFAGERCSQELANRWNNGRRLYNAYGPSEATVCATIHQVQSGKMIPPIGKALPHVEISVVDANNRPVVSQEKGEIVIGGKGVAIGYLNRPELTQQKFITNPRVFKTGDAGFIDEKGNIFFEGRLDRQVKYHGVRLELEYVETLIERCRGVLRCLVEVDIREQGSGVLTAFILKDHLRDEEDLRMELIEHVRHHLPAGIVPCCVFVKDLPLKGSGKVDVKKLFDEYIPLSEELKSRTVVEVIRRLFADRLGVRSIDESDDFFAIGGSSIVFLECIAQLETQLGMRIPIALAVTHRSPRLLAVAIQEYQDGNVIHPDPPLRREELPQLDVVYPRKMDRLGGASLVTGGTGLLGAYLIASLLEKTTEDVYCLVRGADQVHVEERLRSNLEKHGLSSAAKSRRLKCMCGDLSASLFGLSMERYRVLAASVGTVYHSGASVSWVQSYEALKATNVDGTMHVLRFCAESGAKLVYVSSIGVHFSQAWRSLKCFKETEAPLVADHFIGYLRTKWASEQLIQAQGEQGLRWVIVRPPFLCGGSESSEPLAKDDFLFSKIQTCLRLGVSPSEGFYTDIYPANVLASRMVSFAQDLDRECKVIHITNPQKLRWDQVVHCLQSLGYPLRMTSYKEWVSQAASSKLPIYQHRGYIEPYFPDQTSLYETYHGTWPLIEVENTAHDDVGGFVPGVAELLKRYLANGGVFT